MAKRKYEFRPDKPNTDLFSRLYLTKTQRLTILRWILYAALLLVLSVIQDVVLCKVNVLGASTDLVPCAIILICVQMGADRSCIFSLIAATLYQFSGMSPGYYVIALIPLCGVLAAVLHQSFFRKSLSSTLLCSCAAVVLYEACVLGFGLLFRNTIAARSLSFFITALLSLLSYPVLYPLTNAIEKIGEKLWKD